MGSLNFDIYKDNDKNEVTNHYYDDLHLDITDVVIVNADGTYGRDIEIDVDDLAIQNSLANIILTHPGERFLIPTFGCNLYKYLFEPVSEVIAQQIGLTVKEAIENFEPRVVVNKVTVYNLNDTQEYVIDLSIGVPLLSKNFNLVQKLKALDARNL